MRQVASVVSVLVFLAAGPAVAGQQVATQAATAPDNVTQPAKPAAADAPASAVSNVETPIPAAPSAKSEPTAASEPTAKASEPAVAVKEPETPAPAAVAAPVTPEPKAEEPKVAVKEPAATPAVEAPSALAPATAAAPVAELAKVVSPVVALLRERLAAASKTAGADRDERLALKEFYAADGAEPLWVDKSGFSSRGRAALAALKAADEWGLNASDFKVADLASASPTDDHLADAELRLGLAVLKYARHAKGGRIPDPTAALSTYLDRKPQLLAPKTVLAEVAKAADPDKYLQGLHPKHAEFEQLRQQLAALKGGDVAKPVQVPASGPKLVPGKSHPDVALVRKRLGVVAPNINGAEDATLYDEGLAAAVKAFQSGKGISPANGNIGGGTRAALNQGEPTVNAKKIIASMEQWRWMPDDLGDFHVWVNIPEYTVRVVKNGQVVHQERVITGKTDTQTPIFSDKLETVVFHPFWGVPESIKVKEVWPSLVRTNGGGMLAKNGLRIQRGGKDVDPATVDWASTDIRNFHVYQPPGDANVLGVVKFLFPNKHQVYMHDTPTKNLFSASQRTFSHGCMRVRNPVRLAEVILAEDKGWDAKRIASLISSGQQNNEIAVKRSIPVHVTYLTARVEDGKALAFRDVYGHEERITLALEGKWAQIAKGKDHLAPVKAEPIARLAESRAGASPPTTLGDVFKNLFGGF